MPIWRTPTHPEVGDKGQVIEWDAEVVRVHHADRTVTVAVFDDEQGDRLVELPFVTERSTNP
jgi:hypothetical protein